MPENEKKCPCDTVIELQKMTKDQEKRLNDGNVQFAIINTKLSIIMWGLGATCGALIGVIVKLIMGV